MSEGTIFMSGDEGCPKCGGRGVIRVENDSLCPVVKPCSCVLVRQLMQNVNRGWRNLLNAAKLEGDSPLLPLAEANENIWVTGSHNTFRSHLRHVALRMGPAWGFQVKTDADLMISWLASAKLEGIKILDPEVAVHAAPVSSSKLSLPDLVIPPEVLIIFLGVKAARNAAMPEVLYEALNLRVHEQRPVWIVDQPTNPLAHGHRSYDSEMGMLLDEFYRVKLPELQPLNSGLQDPESLEEPQAPQQAGGARRFGFSQGHGGTTRSEVTTEENDTKKTKKRTPWRGGKR